MTRNLAIDVGNTRIKTGLFEDDHFLQSYSWSVTELENFKLFLTNQSIDNVILSTVERDKSAFAALFRDYQLPLLVLEDHTKIPITNAYHSPETLGKDRLAAVVGAYTLFPQEPCLVIDAGTAVTFDLLDAAGIYQGGNISPGWRMRLQALHQFTARLPVVEAAVSNDWIGRSTTTALQNGAFWGICFEIEGYITRLGRQLAGLNVLLTGGDADFLAKKLKSKIFVNQNLVLIGLNKILNYNVQGLE